MKTPEEIKKGLECCLNVWVNDHWKNCDSSCPYQAEQSYCKNVLHHDTLAYIQQLEAQVPKWISVEERVPEGGQWVLVYCGGYANWFDLNKWCGVNWLKTLPVTHWMPLPEPSKEDGHAAD